MDWNADAEQSEVETVPATYCAQARRSLCAMMPERTPPLAVPLPGSTSIAICTCCTGMAGAGCPPSARCSSKSVAPAGGVPTQVRPFMYPLSVSVGDARLPPASDAMSTSRTSVPSHFGATADAA